MTRARILGISGILALSLCSGAEDTHGYPLRERARGYSGKDRRARRVAVVFHRGDVMPQVMNGSPGTRANHGDHDEGAAVAAAPRAEKGTTKEQDLSRAEMSADRGTSFRKSPASNGQPLSPPFGISPGYWEIWHCTTRQNSMCPAAVLNLSPVARPRRVRVSGEGGEPGRRMYPYI